MEAVIIELCRLAVDKQSPTLAEFSSQFFRGSGTFQFLLGTAERDLFVWSQEFVSRMETDTVTGKKRAKLVAK